MYLLHLTLTCFSITNANPCNPPQIKKVTFAPCQSPESKNVADPIIVHPEIRKNLMLMKSVNDGIRGLMLKAGNAFDIIDSNQTSKLTQTSENLIALLTFFFCILLGGDKSLNLLLKYL